MGLLSLILCDLTLVPIAQEWAIEQILSATIVMEELDQFSPHSITVNGSFRQNLALLGGLTAVQIIDDEIGTIAYGLLDDPEDQITAQDEHTITLQLPNITEALRYSTTGQGWVAGYVPPAGSLPSGRGPGTSTALLSLDTTVARLGSLRYGWTARCVDYGGDTPYVLRFEDATILGALLDTANATGGHARQGHDATGAPTTSIELGIFGGAPSIQIVTAEGGNVNDILTNNPDARLAQTITRHPADATKLVNVMTPLGGGSGVSQVRFRRLFRMLYDPTYEHYYTKDPRGLANLFPEYDTNYPIPAVWDAVANRYSPARPMKGDSNQWEVAARLDGGADGYEYCIVDLASLNAWNAKYPHLGEFRSPFTDSTFSYVDSDINNQEMSERALYVAAKAQLAWFSQPQQSVTVTTVGNRRPPRAGQTVQIEYQRVGYDVQGAFAEVNEQGVYMITSVVRQYGDVVIDTWTVTTNGKHPPDPTSRSADATRGMVEALRLIPTTSVAIYPLDTGRVKIDSTHFLTKHWEIPASAFRVQQCKILVTLFPVRHDLQQAHTDGDHQHDVAIPALQVNGFNMPDHVHQSPIPLHTHGSFSQGTHDHGNININHGQGTSVPAAGGGTVNNSGTAGNIASQLNGHQHTTTFGSGGNPGTGDTSGIFYYSGTGSPNGGAYIQSVGRGGQLMTNPFNYNANSDHGHGSSVPATGGGNVGNFADGGRGMGQAGAVGFATTGTSFPTNLTNYTVPTAFTGITTATTTSTIASGQGTTHSGSHTHTFDVGIYETDFASKRVQLWIDAGDGQGLVDRTNTIGWDGVSSMSQSIDITTIVEQAAGKNVVFELRGEYSDGNPFGLTEIELSGFGVVELSAVGSQVLTA